MIGSKEFPCKTADEVKFAIKGKKHVTIVAYGDIVLSDQLAEKIMRRHICIYPIRREEDDNKTT